MNVTEREIKVLKALATNNFMDDRKGDDRINHHLWSDCIDCPGIAGKELSGIVSSLSQKGLVGAEGKGRDATIWLTRAGCNLIDLDELDRNHPIAPDEDDEDD